MGFFSSIVKGIKNIFKGVKKVVKKVFKAVKKFAKSGLGKVLLTAAAIYVGGGMLGAWQTPTWLGGTATSTLGAVPAAAATGTEIATGSTALTADAGLAAAEAASVGMAAPGTVAEAASAIPTTMAATAPAATESAGLLSTLGEYGGKTVDWMAANPALTIAGAKGVTAALAPDPYEEWRKKQEFLRNRSNIAGISGTGEGAPIGMGLISQAENSDLYTPTYTAPQRG